jgi:hypothetical protein
VKAYQFAIENNGHPHAIVSKTHRQLYDALLPELHKALNLMGCPYRMRDGNKLILEVGPSPTTFHLWTAHNRAYLNWPGFNLAGAIVDEWDTFSEPQSALEYINDRIRVDCALPQTAITSSPEGYGDFYRRFEKEVKEDGTGRLPAGLRRRLPALPPQPPARRPARQIARPLRQHQQTTQSTQPLMPAAVLMPQRLRPPRHRAAPRQHQGRLLVQQAVRPPRLEVRLRRQVLRAPQPAQPQQRRPAPMPH